MDSYIAISIPITFLTELSHIGLDKSGYQVNIFSYFSMKTFVEGTH